MLKWKLTLKLCIISMDSPEKWNPQDTCAHTSVIQHKELSPMIQGTEKAYNVLEPQKCQWYIHLRSRELKSKFPSRAYNALVLTVKQRENFSFFYLLFYWSSQKMENSSTVQVGITYFTQSNNSNINLPQKQIHRQIQKQCLTWVPNVPFKVIWKIKHPKHFAQFTKEILRLCCGT